MIRVTCDGCDKPIDRDNDRYFGVDLNEPIQQIELPDPVDEMNAREDQMTSSLIRVSLGGEPENHFCSPECLSAWAFSKGLDS